jgi:hypothetical protein
MSNWRSVKVSMSTCICSKLSQQLADYLQEQPQHQQHLSVPTTPPQVPDSLPHPAAKPMFNQQSSRQPNMQHIVQPSMHPAQQPLQATIPQQIFMATFKRNHTLMPVAPTTEPIGSRRVDAIAHGCWDVVFSKEALMTDITMKAAFYTPLKLRALARLNWLPSWWFLREMAVSLMKQQGWMIDDSERMGEWHEAVDWCKKAEMKCFGGGADAGAGAATQDVGLCATQIQELQAAAAAAATKQVES